MRIATWNLERPRPRSWKRLPRQRERMAAVGADIWVLTETRASVSPGEGFDGVHAPPHPVRRVDPDERWVSIWSRWPLRPTGLPPDPRGAASAIIATPVGDVVVYGTHRGRALLTTALDEADLTCVTAEDVVTTGKLHDAHLVDHISVCRRWASETDITLHCWERTDSDGVQLSDHPTVAIDLDVRTRRPS